MVAWAQRNQVFILVALVMVIVAGVWVFSATQSQSLYFSQKPPDSAPAGEVYLDGNVVNPGIYPMRQGDTIGDVVRAAGAKGPTGFLRVSVHVAAPAEAQQEQKVNINTAGAWLLEALPGVGKVTAAAIVEYRQHSRFRSVEELALVPGIGRVTYERLKDYVTVAD